jgi:acylphosphatase
VGFRYFAYEAARDLALTGWVRNRWDGTVEVVAEGPREALEGLLAALARGPRVARVERVDHDWEDATGEFKTFGVRLV